MPPDEAVVGLNTAAKSGGALKPLKTKMLSDAALPVTEPELMVAVTWFVLLVRVAGAGFSGGVIAVVMVQDDCGAIVPPVRTIVDPPVAFNDPPQLFEIRLV